MIDCRNKSVRQVNHLIKVSVEDGNRCIELLSPRGMHNLGVGITTDVDLVIKGDVGHYCVAMTDQMTTRIHGNAGWGLAENMMGGKVSVSGNVGNAAAASLRGGEVIVKGNAGARAGIAVKGGLLIVLGSVGYMSGFMMQKGALIIAGDAEEGLGDSMYAGAIYIAGAVAQLGNDAVEVGLSDDDEVFLETALASCEGAWGSRFRKVISGGMLHTFDQKEYAVWKNAL